MEPMRFESWDKQTHARRYLNGLSISCELGPPRQHEVNLVFSVRLLRVSGAGLQTINANAQIV